MRPFKGSRSQFELVAFVPATPGSELQGELQREDNKFSRRQGVKPVRFVEKGGILLRQFLVKYIHFKLGHWSLWSEEVLALQ